MANEYNAISNASSVSKNLVQTAYDKYVEFQLRSMPCFREIVDKHPADQAMPGSSVVLQIYQDLAPSITPLNEITDPESVALPATSTVSITLNEYGRSTITTRKLRLFSLSDLDPALMNVVSYDMTNSLDKVISNVLVGGTNVIRVNAGAVVIGGTQGAIVPTDIMESDVIRTAVTKLRTNNALPRMGDLFTSYIHPDVAFDLRKESDAAGWRPPHVYSAAGNIWAGFVGSYEGTAVIESPRVNVSKVTGKPDVYQNIMVGQQALAEAVAEEGSLRMGPYTDALMRLRKVGWYAVLGWSIYRQEAIFRMETASSLGVASNP
ncbi:N4-gp56 family major capsid protein [Longispora urticae]